MEFISIFFIILSTLVILYLSLQIKKSRRVNFLFEFAVVGIYIGVALIFLFPQILSYIEHFLGISSAINFILYLSIFVLFFIVFVMYSKIDDLRQNITKLTREIALMNKDEKKGKKKN